MLYFHHELCYKNIKDEEGKNPSSPVSIFLIAVYPVPVSL